MFKYKSIILATTLLVASQAHAGFIAGLIVGHMLSSNDSSNNESKEPTQVYQVPGNHELVICEKYGRNQAGMCSYYVRGQFSGDRFAEYIPANVSPEQYACDVLWDQQKDCRKYYIVNKFLVKESGNYGYYSMFIELAPVKK